MNDMGKIDYEYHIFFLDCMRQSKAGIYARSDEIHIKREIKRSLNRILQGNNIMEEKLNKIDSVLEEAYRYVKDCEDDVPIDNLVRQWINTL